MILLEKLREILKLNTIKADEEIQKQNEEMQRSNEDWPVIRDYIKGAILRISKENNYYTLYQKKYLELQIGAMLFQNPVNENGNKIILNNGEQLKINPFDMIKFLQEEKINFKIGVKSYFNNDFILINPQSDFVFNKNVISYGYPIIAGAYKYYYLMSFLIKI